LLLLNFLTSKHGKVVQYGYIYIKYLEVASMHFDYAAQLALQEN
jgi:isocitrate dehydrogenase kinase/phosphatase